MRHVSETEAIGALAENLSKTLPEKEYSANLSRALMYICNELERIGRDVNLLHSKIQPFLKEKSDDADLTRRTTRK